MNLTAPLRRSLSRAAFGYLETFGRLVSERGGDAFLVGGPVRDILLGKPLLDIDVVATHPVEPAVRALAARHKGRLEKRSAFLTFKLSFPDDIRMDVATARKETYPAPASLPVVQPSEPLHDLARRDFSINAMALSLLPSGFGELIDPLGGMMDLAARRLRALHPRSFMDDPTRIYRAARYAGRFHLHVDPETLGWIRSAIRLKIPASLSPARLSHEWIKVLMERDPRPALKFLDSWGALSFLSPAWRWRPEHGRSFKPSDHSLALRLLSWCRPFGPKKSEATLARLELPSQTRGEVRLGLGLLEAIERRDPLASLGATRAPESVRQFLSRTLPTPLWERVTRSRPLLSGTDLAGLGVPQGHETGRMLAELTHARWRKTLRSRRDEVRFVIDNLRNR
jgi:tRNA nucleotidyltransferase (CCA-adding enzyme)